LSGIVISAIARVELPAAFWRKQRSGEIEAETARLLTSAFRIDLHGQRSRKPRFVPIGLADRVLEEATSACVRDGLRTLAGLQLASAILGREADPGCTAFACFDRRLREAAASHGFGLVPESL
jgi:hypothetical protein